MPEYSEKYVANSLLNCLGERISDALRYLLSFQSRSHFCEIIAEWLDVSTNILTSS